MAFQIIITNAGRAALINAQHLGTAPVVIAQVGLTATAITPSPSANSLAGEFKRLSTMSGAVVADDTIHLTVRDEGSQSFTVRSFGLYLADGTLFGIYGQSDVLIEKSVQSIMLLAVDIKFADIAAATLAFGNTDFLMPPATKTAQGVVELATEAETKAGTDDARAVTPKDNKSAFNQWINDRFGADAPSPLLKEILALALVEDVRTALGLKSAALKNEGIGGGLNADLLDGHHADYFTNIIARLGYTPLNAAHYTAADVLAKLLTVDGAGSGLDADRLNGQAANYFTNIPARLGYTPLNAANYTAADILAKLLTVDGAGSGVDADFLDGLHASSFIKTSDFTHLNSASGYVIFPSRLAMQWRRGAAQTNQSTQTVTWPLAFSTIFDVQVTTSIPTNTINHDAWFQVLGTPTLTGCTLVRQATNSEVSGAGTPIIFAYGIIG